MFSFAFSKERAETVLAALNTNSPIPPPVEGWSQDDDISVAGICLARAALCGSQLKDALRGLRNREHAEAIADTGLTQMNFAVRQVAELAFLVNIGWYDDRYNPVASAIVNTDSTGAPFVEVWNGKKDR